MAKRNEMIKETTLNNQVTELSHSEEPSELLRELVAQVREDPFPGPAGEVGLSRGGGPVRDSGRQERDDEQREQVEVVWPDPVVDRKLREIGGH